MQTYDVSRGQTAVFRITIKRNGRALDVSDYDLFRLDIGIANTQTVVVTKSTATSGEGEISGDETGLVLFYLTSADTLSLKAAEYVAQVWGKRGADRPFVRWPECSVVLRMCQPLGSPPA